MYKSFLNLKSIRRAEARSSFALCILPSMIEAAGFYIEEKKMSGE